VRCIQKHQRDDAPTRAFHRTNQQPASMATHVDDVENSQQTAKNRCGHHIDLTPADAALPDQCRHRRGFPHTSLTITGLFFGQRARFPGPACALDNCTNKKSLKLQKSSLSTSKADEECFFVVPVVLHIKHFALVLPCLSVYRFDLLQPYHPLVSQITVDTLHLQPGWRWIAAARDFAATLPLQYDQSHAQSRYRHLHAAGVVDFACWIERRCYSFYICRLYTLGQPSRLQI